jgi:hypothetical protein
VKAPAPEEIPKPARWIRWRGFFQRRWSFVAPSLVSDDVEPGSKTKQVRNWVTRPLARVVQAVSLLI